MIKILRLLLLFNSGNWTLFPAVNQGGKIVKMIDITGAEGKQREGAMV